MRVVILYNAVSQHDTIEDKDVLIQVDVVSQSLKRLGHELYMVACTLDLDLMREKLQRLRPDVVFNLVEALHGDDSLIYLPPAVLDTMSVPYTGACAESLFLTTHKLLAKDRLFHAGLPTPAWIVQSPNSGDSMTFDLPADLSATTQITAAKPSRWIVKGVWEQGSRDMDDDAVFSGDRQEVQERLRERVNRTGRPAFAEEFIDGREFNLAMLTGPGSVEILPPAEIDFSTFPAKKLRIVGYRAKWLPDSFEYNNTPQRFDFPEADRPLLDHLQDLAMRCWELFMLRGWARIDFRVDQNGRPWILEVNANPCLSPDAGFATALQHMGVSFDEAIRRILEEALMRHREVAETASSHSQSETKKKST